MHTPAEAVETVTPDAQYIDVLERTLYNEVLGGVAITGNAFFYNNKLLSTGEGWGSLRQRWFRCAFPEPTKVSSVEVYWLDQGDQGPCRMPTSWRVLYRDDSRWKVVENAGPYGLRADTFNRVEFKPVETTILRMEATLQEGFSGGIFEWRVE